MELCRSIFRLLIKAGSGFGLLPALGRLLMGPRLTAMAGLTFKAAFRFRLVPTLAVLLLGIVIGLPLNMDGTPGMLTENVNSFAETLREKIGIPVELYDERMTTMQVDRMLTEEADVSRDKRKQVRDKLAASLILQSYLDLHS